MSTAGRFAHRPGTVLTGAAYGLYRTVTVGASVLGVTLLLVAAVTLGLALRDED